MKVCMLVELLPPAFGGGARQALHLARQLRQSGVDVFFVSAQVVPGSAREDTLDGFAVYRVPYASTGKWTKLRGLVGFWRLLWQHRHRFEVLHVHSAYYLILAAAMFAKYGLGKRLLVKLTSIASDTPSAILRRSYPRVTWWMYRRADAWVCMSPAQAIDCRQHGLPDSKIHLIPNGVDLARFHPSGSAEDRTELRARLGLSPVEPQVVFIGTIEKDKGVELLVDAAALVCQERRDVKFLLIGPDGSTPGETHVRPEFVQALREKIRAIGLSEHVRLLGRQTNTEEYLRAATLFVFPSRSEGFGTVVIEAMASGLPCVALDIPNVTAEIITTGQDGVIIATEHPAAFAEAIHRLLSDAVTARRLGQAAQETAQRKFSIERVAERYSDLYVKLGRAG
jgi:glycosyltransferase involved in cell wall biosynthesis